MLTVGDKFPTFELPACVSLEKNGVRRLNNETFAGKWVVYFFYPKDFSFICPTELFEFSKKNKDFNERNAVVVAGSTDNEYSHQAWRRGHPDLKDLPFAMLAAGKLAGELGILEPTERVCLRATFLVDPEGVIRWAVAYPYGVVRNVGETLRVLQAIQDEDPTPAPPIAVASPSAVGCCL